MSGLSSTDLVTRATRALHVSLGAAEKLASTRLRPDRSGDVDRVAKLAGQVRAGEAALEAALRVLGNAPAADSIGDGALGAALLGTDPAALVRAGADHLAVLRAIDVSAGTGVPLDDAAATVRIRELLRLDGDDARAPARMRELNLLLDHAPNGARVFDQLPRELAGVKLRDVVKRAGTGTATPQDAVALSVWHDVAHERAAAVDEAVAAIADPAVRTDEQVLRAAMIADSPLAPARGITTRIAGADTAQNLLGSLSTGAATDRQRALVDRYVAAWRTQLAGTVADATTARDAMRNAIGNDDHVLDADDWRRVRALLDADGEPGLIAVSRDVRGGGKLERVVDDMVDGVDNSARAQRYLATWRLQLDPSLDDPAAAREAMRSLLQVPIDQLSQQQWSRIGALLDLDDARGDLRITHRLGGSPPAEAIIASLADGSRTAGKRAERYVQAWRVELDDALRTLPARRSAAATILRNDPDVLSSSDWMRFEALVGRAGEPLALPLLRSQPRLDDAAAVLERAVRGADPDDALRSYVASWRRQLDDELSDPARLRDRWVSLLARDPSTFGRDDWSTMRLALASGAASGAIDATRWLAGQPSADRVLGSLAAGEPAGDAIARYLAAWRAPSGSAAADERAAMTAELRELVDEPFEKLGARAWRRLAEIDEADRTIDAIGLVRSWHRGPDTGALLRSLADGSAAPDQGARRLVETWRMQLDGLLDDPAASRREFQRIVDKRANEITRREWLRLQVLFDHDYRAGDLGVTHSLDQGARGTTLLSGLVDGSTSIAGGSYHAERLLATWRVEAGSGYAVPVARAAAADGTLGAHFIRRSEVADYLRDSVWKHTVFHGSTNPDTYQSILDNGALIGRNKRSQWGRGFYCALEPGGWGLDIHEVAVRTERPFVASTSDFQGKLAKLRGGNDVRSTLLANGYDSIVLLRSRSNGGDWVIGLDDSRIKVVVEDPPGGVTARPAAPWTFDGSS